MKVPFANMKGTILPIILLLLSGCACPCLHPSLNDKAAAGAALAKSEPLRIVLHSFNSEKNAHIAWLLPESMLDLAITAAAPGKTTLQVIQADPRLSIREVGDLSIVVPARMLKERAITVLPVPAPSLQLQERLPLNAPMRMTLADLEDFVSASTGLAFERNFGFDEGDWEICLPGISAMNVAMLLAAAADAEMVVKGGLVALMREKR